MSFMPATPLDRAGPHRSKLRRSIESISACSLGAVASAAAVAAALLLIMGVGLGLASAVVWSDSELLLVTMIVVGVLWLTLTHLLAMAMIGFRSRHVIEEGGERRDVNTTEQI